MTVRRKVTDKIIEQMNLTEWARYLAETVYVLWFEVFSIALPKYQSVSPKLI